MVWIKVIIIDLKNKLESWIDKRNEFCAFVDFDGVIADTEPFQALSYSRVLNQHGVSITEDDFKKYIGNNEYTIYEMIERDYKISIDKENILMERSDILIEIIINGKLKPNNEVLDVIDFIKSKGGNSYILSANRQWIISKLLNHWNIQHKFKNIFSVFDLNINKSDFLNCCQNYSSVDVTNCIVIEDSYLIAKDSIEKGAFVIPVQHSLSDSKIKLLRNVIKVYR